MSNKRNCYKQNIKVFDLIVCDDCGDCDLTIDKVYVVLDVVGPELIKVVDDTGEEEIYSTEWFRFYEGERVW